MGGVDWQGLPLPNSRTKGLPVRVAYGDHAAAEVDTTGRAVYTGSSVSTVVVSAAAALIWRLRPELKPAEVMGLIDRSGERQEAQAEFYAGRDRKLWPRPAPHLREISLCAAVREACGPGGLKCSAAGDPASTCGPLDHQPADLYSILKGSDSDPSTDPIFPFPAPIASPLTPPCHAGTLLLIPTDPTSQPICPTDQYSSVSAQPWVLPQPGDDPCPNCTLVPTGPPNVAKTKELASEGLVTVSVRSAEPNRYQLAIAMNQTWFEAQKDTNLNVTAMLDIDCFAGGTFTRTTYPVQIDWVQGLAWTALGLGDGKSLKGCRAQLNFVVTKESQGATNEATLPVTVMSIQNPVLVDPYLSDASSRAANPLGSDKNLEVSSTKVLKVSEKERKKGPDTPF